MHFRQLKPNMFNHQQWILYVRVNWETFFDILSWRMATSHSRNAIDLDKKMLNDRHGWEEGIQNFALEESFLSMC